MTDNLKTNQSMGGFKLTNLASPTIASDAITCSKLADNSAFVGNWYIHHQIQSFDDLIKAGRELRKIMYLAKAL